MIPLAVTDELATLPDADTPLAVDRMLTVRESWWPSESPSPPPLSLSVLRVGSWRLVVDWLGEAVRSVVDTAEARREETENSWRT